MSYQSDFQSTITPAVNELPRNYGKFAKKVLKELQDIFIKEIRKKAPRNTGDYANSWKAGTVSDIKATIQTPKGKLFMILEFQGRKPGRIEGDPLAFVVNGEEVFVTFVNHPGFKEIPHARPAMRVTIQQANQVIRKHMKSTFRLFR